MPCLVSHYCSCSVNCTLLLYGWTCQVKFLTNKVFESSNVYAHLVVLSQSFHLTRFPSFSELNWTPKAMSHNTTARLAAAGAFPYFGQLKMLPRSNIVFEIVFKAKYPPDGKGNGFQGYDSLTGSIL